MTPPSAQRTALSAPPRPRGFTLIELAIVLVIVGLLVGGMTVMFSAVQDNNNLKETRNRLAQAQEALLGFAAGNGRLPCPAAPPNVGGAESPLGTGACTDPLNGFLPATTLGLNPTDEQGYLLDGWGNRIRYAVYKDAIKDKFAADRINAFTTAGTMKDIGLEILATNPAPTPRKLLNVCDSATGIAAANCGTARTLTDNAVAVVFSTGKNGGGEPAGDEAKNTDGDTVFVATTAAGFDDVVAWLSPNILYNRMIAAGRLP